MFIKVKVMAGAKRESITKETNGKYRIEVKEPAERNEANLKVRQLLAKALGLSPGTVKLISGHQRPNKMFEVTLKVKE